MCKEATALIKFDELSKKDKIVLSTKRITLADFPGAYNPSLIKVDQGFLLTFRYLPDRENQWDLSCIGVVLLDDSFEQISKPQLLNTRSDLSKIPSHAEDARIFSYKGRLFLIYNDNLNEISVEFWQRRDMHIAELFYESNQFVLSAPLKLVYEEKYNERICQKNWVPFEWNNKLLLCYAFNPHEILYPNLISGECYFFHQTSAPITWNWGSWLKPSSPPQLVDGEYLAFFHSGMITSSDVSWGWDLWHYFMGAYTFSADPPFEITKMTLSPIVGKGFYTLSFHEKRVIFPGGFVVADPFIYVAYGKDDCEIWIAVINKQELKKALVPVKK